MDNSVSAIINTTLQTQIMQALSDDGAEYITQLVEAACKDPVDPHNGKSDSYSSARVPYIEYAVKRELTNAVDLAITNHVRSLAEEIKAAVELQLSGSDVVQGFTSAVLGTVKEEWRTRIHVNFERDKDN